MTFSGALQLTDLDDFLAPSQACILPVKQTNKVANQENGINADTEIRIDEQNNYYEVAISKPPSHSSTLTSSKTSSLYGGVEKPLVDERGQVQQLQKAEISLNDCLACSGCVTSTESLLITLQSHLEVQSYISNHIASTSPNPLSPPSSSSTSTPQPDYRTGVISISPQTLASLSASYSASSPNTSPIPLLTLLHRIRHFLSLPENGSWKVWDTTFARHLSLLEHVKEFKERSAVGKGKQREQFGSLRINGDSNEAKLSKSAAGSGLPMLASACPGWVCYAEKAHGDLLGFMSATRSSQGVMGGLVKHWWGQKHKKRPDAIYHVTVMPCYDKKLEASRQDFYSELYQTRDVDCVLTTGELDLLLRERGFDPYQPVPNEEAQEVSEEECPFPELLTHPGSSSGSYLHTIIDAISRECIHSTRLITRPIRNSDDHVEYILEDAVTGEILFKGAKCYGFRNLQNLVRKLGKETGLKSSGRGAGAAKVSALVAARRRAAKVKAGKILDNDGSTTDGTITPSGSESGEERTLDYVEVMACPGGCVNGGGQMKPVAPETQVHANGTLDDEGYPRVMEVEGVENPKSGIDESMRWSTKEWVSKVESLYWHGLPTPPPSPTIGSQRDCFEVSVDKESAKTRKADEVAKKIIAEACKPLNGQYSDQMDEEAEKRRWEMLRTRYRKVESDITGLQAANKW